MKLSFSRQARADLREIRSYIAERDPAAAKRVGARLDEAIAKLATNPQIGRKSDLGNLHVFSVVTDPYRIYYEIRHDEDRIAHIRHTARQDWAGSE